MVGRRVRLKRRLGHGEKGGKGGKGKGKGGSFGFGNDDGAGAADCMATAGAAVCARRLMGVPLAAVLPPLDACVDRLMRLCVEDLFGEAAEAREATDVLKNDVKEAKDAKTYDVIEVRTFAVRKPFSR